MIIFISLLDSNNMMGRVGHEDVDTMSDAESAVGNMLVTGV